MHQELLQTVGRIVESAAQTALDLRSNLQTEKKQDGSLVTNADIAAEDILRAGLTEALPGSTFWGEEGGFAEEGESGIWLVDPIDGTTNFAFGQPLWATSAGLYADGRLRLGAVCLPELGWLVTGSLGQRPTCNGEPLALLRADRIQCHEPVGEDDQDPFPIHGKYRHLGSVVVEAMFMARGMLRAFSSARCKLYDAAASLVILRELGAEARHADGRPLVESEWLQPCPIEPFVVLPSSDYVL
ncbi:MAG: inositol monophosphatase [Fimbriimonadaceae bacterium]